MPEQGMSSMVIVESLTKNFGSKTAVDHVSFEIPQGEAFGLVGPNGAGKTTTVKMLTTLLPPTGGSARIHGYDIRKQPSQVRRFIGYVPGPVHGRRPHRLREFADLLQTARHLRRRALPAH